MKKYKITSIPQFRNGGSKLKKQKSNNNFFDFFRRKNRNSEEENEPVVQSGFNAPVEEEFVTPTWADTWPAEREPYEKLYSDLPEYTTDPNQQDKPLSERTGLELVSTQSEFGNAGYGYKRDPFTNQLVIKPAGTPTYERDIFGNLITEVRANPDIPVDYQGNPLKCGPGTRPYKGVCVTNEEYAQIKAKEESDLEYRDQVYKQELEDERIKQNQEFIKKIDDYIKVASTPGNKHKKGILDPVRTFTKSQWESDPNFEKFYNDKQDPYRQAFYVEKKKLKDGDYQVNFYPKEAMFNLIKDYGVRPWEFKRYHDLDDAQVAEEFADEIRVFDAYYLKQGDDFVENYVKRGLSKDQALEKLRRDKGYGDRKGLNKNFGELANAYDIQYNADKYFVDDKGVMYKKDAKGNVYRYSNDPDNPNFEIQPDSQDETQIFKENGSGKNYGFFPVDKSLVTTNKDGTINIKNPTTGEVTSSNLYDYGFGSRGDKKENTILTDYKSTINKAFKESQDSYNYESQQSPYKSANDAMYNFVYGNPSSTKMEKLPITSALTGNLNNQYVNEYNKTVDEINKAGTVQEKGAILEKFINRMSKYNTPVYDSKGPSKNEQKINWGSMSNYGGASVPILGFKNLTAYKNPESIRQAKDLESQRELDNYLKFAYANGINLDSKNAIKDDYRGESLQDKYGSYFNFLNAPETKQFIEDYKKQPYFGQEMFKGISDKMFTNIEKDKQAEALKRAKELQGKVDLPWYLDIVDQTLSFANQPVNTFQKWKSGQLQDPFVGLMSDNPTSDDLNEWNQMYGPGGDQLYINKLNEVNSSLIGQATNLFSPFHWAAQTGNTAHSYFKGDKEQKLSDVALNSLFAFLPASKAVQGLMGTKLLPGLTKYGLGSNKVYNAARTLFTPGNALTGYFANHAFMPHTDEFGKTHQGFGIEAYKNIWDALNEEKGINTEKINQNLLNAYMATTIGKHAFKSGNKFVKGATGFGIPEFKDTRFYEPTQNLKYDIARNFTSQPFKMNGKVHFVSPMETQFGIEGGWQPTKNTFGSMMKNSSWLNRGPGPLMLGMPKVPSIEVKNPDFYSDVMKINKYSPAQKKFYEGVINSVKSQGNMATDRQKMILDDIKNGTNNYGKKGYALGGELPKAHNGKSTGKGGGRNKIEIDKETKELLNEPHLNIKSGESVFSPTEHTNYLGDFTFKDFSPGAKVRQELLNAFDNPQWAPGKNDFYTNKEFQDLINKQIEHNEAWKTFEEMNPEDPATAVWSALTGDNSRDELFSNLFPNSYAPNFRSKFLSPEQEGLLNDAGLSNPTFTNRGMLNQYSLKGLTKGQDTLPKSYNDLLQASKKETGLSRLADKDIVMEMRGLLKLKLEDIKNASPEQLNKWVKEIDKKMYQQRLDRWNKDIEKPFKGSDAWQQISKQAGYKNKLGGVSMQLSQKEIDKYVQGGYIVEEE
jgi:hypothetical protein